MFREKSFSNSSKVVPVLSTYCHIFFSRIHPAVDRQRAGAVSLPRSVHLPAAWPSLPGKDEPADRREHAADRRPEGGYADHDGGAALEEDGPTGRSHEGRTVQAR